MTATAAPRLVINGQTVSTDLVAIPGLTISVDVLVGADPAFPTFGQMVDFDPIADWMCKGAELGDAVPLAQVERCRCHGRISGIWDDGGPQFTTCDCHGYAWPAEMVEFRDGPDTYECVLPRDDNPLPASFQRQAMR